MPPMLEVAEIFRLHGPAYREKFGDRMLPSHRRAMQDIETCRTESLGGQLYFCAQCKQQRYSYHSCKNRHCPKCQNEQANDWLAAQQSLLLPTHSLPGHLHPARRVARPGALPSKDDLQLCSFALPPPPCCNWPRTRASSAPA